MRNEIAIIINNVGLADILKQAALVVIISFAASYFVYFKSKQNPPLLPGDVYYIKGGNRVYIPLGSTLIISILLFLFLRFLQGIFIPSA